MAIQITQVLNNLDSIRTLIHTKLLENEQNLTPFQVECRQEAFRRIDEALTFLKRGELNDETVV